MKIALASDHAGFEAKKIVINYLIKNGYEIQDFGTHSTQSCDYPDFAHPLALSIENHENNLGITFCGSGNGINMTANKHKSIRSALCWNPEIAQLARLHNDANVCAVPARFTSEKMILSIVKTFIETPFEGGRHQNRIDKI